MNRMPSAEPGLSGITAVACILGMAGLAVLAGHDLGYGNTARFLVVFFVLPVIIAAIVDFRLGLLVCLISNLLQSDPSGLPDCRITRCQYSDAGGYVRVVGMPDILAKVVTFKKTAENQPNFCVVDGLLGLPINLCDHYQPGLL